MFRLPGDQLGPELRPWTRPTLQGAAVCELGDVLDQLGFVGLIRQLCDDDDWLGDAGSLAALPAAATGDCGVLLNESPAPDSDGAAARQVGVRDALCRDDFAACSRPARIGRQLRGFPFDASMSAREVLSSDARFMFDPLSDSLLALSRCAADAGDTTQWGSRSSG